MNPKQIYVEGIRHVSALDIQFAEQLGYTIKLLGIIKQIRIAAADRADQKSRGPKSENRNAVACRFRFIRR